MTDQPMPVYDRRAWQTYRRDAKCDCTAPDPVDCASACQPKQTRQCPCHYLSVVPTAEELAAARTTPDNPQTSSDAANNGRAVRVLIDLNVRFPDGRTRAGLEDADGPLVSGQTVEVWEAESGVRGPGLVSWIDEAKRLVYLAVDWAQLRAEDAAPNSGDAADNSGTLTLDRATATTLRDTLNALLGDDGAELATPDDGLREQYAAALSACIKRSVIISSMPGMIGQPFAATEYDMADAVLAIRDRHLEQLAANLAAERASLTRWLKRAADAHDRAQAAEAEAQRLGVWCRAAITVKDRQMEELAAELATADRIRAEVQVDRDRLAAKVDYARGQVIQMSERAQQAEQRVEIIERLNRNQADTIRRVRVLTGRWAKRTDQLKRAAELLEAALDGKAGR